MAFKLLIKNKFISTCLGTVSVLLGVCFLLPLNNFSVYITSYIHYKDNYVTIHYGLFIYLIYMFSNTFSNSLGGYFENLIGFTYTNILGFFTTFCSNLLFIFQRNIWICYALSLFLGIGCGISNSLLAKNLTLYHPDKKGVINGLYGIGILIFSAVFAISGEKIINASGYTFSGNEKFYPQEIAKKTYLYFLVGEIIMFFAFIFALLLLHEYQPEENGKESNIENLITDKKEEANENNETNVEKQKEKEEKNVTKETKGEKKLNVEESKKKIKQVIKTIRFWRITFAIFLVNLSISFMNNTGRTFGALIGINGTALQFTSVLQTFVVILLAPALGIIVDKKGPLLILRILALINIAPGFLLAFWMENDFIFISCYILCVVSLTGMMVGLVPFIMDVYGIQESVILSGIVNGISKIGDAITTVSAFVFSLVCGDTKDENGNDMEKSCLKKRYAIMYIISGICCVCSTILLFIENKNKFQYGDTPCEDPLVINDEIEKDAINAINSDGSSEKENKAINYDEK